MQQLAIRDYRRMLLFRGIIAILLGILILVWPRIALFVLVYLFGAFAVVGGIIAVATALRYSHEEGWALLLVEGILGIVAGVVAFAWPGITLLFFVFLDCDRYPGDREGLHGPVGRWARVVARAGWACVYHLWHSHRHTTFLRAVCNRLADWHLRNCLWHPVHRALLPVALTGSSGLAGTASRPALRGESGQKMLAIDPVLSPLRGLHAAYSSSRSVLHRGSVNSHAVASLRRHRREHAEIWSLNVQPGRAAQVRR